MTFFVFSVFPAPDSPLQHHTRHSGVLWWACLGVSACVSVCEHILGTRSPIYKISYDLIQDCLICYSQLSIAFAVFNMFVCISFMCLRVHVDLIHLWLPEMINVVCFVCLLRSSYKEQTTYDSDLRSAVRGTDRRSKHAYRNCDAMQRKPCKKKAVFNVLRQLTMWHSLPHLLLRAVLRRGCCWPPAWRRCSNRSISPGRRPTAANPQQWRVAAAGGTNGQTDGRTDARQQHRPRSAYYAGSANNTDEIINKYNLNLYVISIDWFSRSETQQIMYTQYDIIHVHRVSKKAMTFYFLITRSKINDCNKYVSILVFRIGMWDAGHYYSLAPADIDRQPVSGADTGSE